MYFYDHPLYVTLKSILSFQPKSSSPELNQYNENINQLPQIKLNMYDTN